MKDGRVYRLNTKRFGSDTGLGCTKVRFIVRLAFSYLNIFSIIHINLGELNIVFGFISGVFDISL